MLTPIQREHLELIRATTGGTLRPREVLADARNPNSPLHDLFLWNDTEAAEAYRLIQAKEVVKVVVRMTARAKREPTRVVVRNPSPDPSPGDSRKYYASLGSKSDELEKEFRDAIKDLVEMYGSVDRLKQACLAIQAVVADLLPDRRRAASPKPSPNTYGGASRPHNGTLARFAGYDHAASPPPKTEAALAANHPALTEKRTIFPASVHPVADADHVLISGHNSSKIGAFVTKGPWAGMPIYTLTLEERATCPDECHLWKECYGNSTPLAKRWEYGAELLEKLIDETDEKAREHTAGFVVRLHVLGDFPDAAYVEFWRVTLEKLPQLHVFGYTAHPRYSLIGTAIAEMNRDFPNRCAIRFSVAPEADTLPMQATAIWRKERGRVAEGLVCPASSGDTECCGTCGLCWAPAMADTRIVFLGHGMRKRSGAETADSTASTAMHTTAAQSIAVHTPVPNTTPLPPPKIAKGSSPKPGNIPDTPIRTPTQSVFMPPRAPLPSKSAAKQFPGEDEIQRFIREKGVTKLPAAAIGPTTAELSPADQAAIAEHQRLKDEQLERQYRGWPTGASQNG